LIKDLACLHVDNDRRRVLPVECHSSQRLATREREAKRHLGRLWISICNICIYLRVSWVETRSWKEDDRSTVVVSVAPCYGCSLAVSTLLQVLDRMPIALWPLFAVIFYSLYLCSTAPPSNNHPCLRGARDWTWLCLYSKSRRYTA
jgi:hypothetical protein